MTTEQNKAVLRQLVNAQNAGDLTVYNRMCTPDCLVHINMMDAGTMQQAGQFMGALQAGFPDGAYTVEDTVTEGDRIAVRYSCRALTKARSKAFPQLERRLGSLFLRLTDSPMANWPKLG